MSILKRLNGDRDEHESEMPGSGEAEIIPGRAGRPGFSLAALQERIEAQFNEEVSQRQDILLEEQDESARRGLVREVAEYIIAVESLSLSHAEKEALIDAAYANLFTFGPLDAVLKDDSVTELTLDGHDSIHIRRSMNAPQRIPSQFDDVYHLAQIIERMLTSADAQFLDSEPFMEVGLMMLGRSARLTLVAPPLSPVLHLDIRLHPAQRATLDTLLERGTVTETSLALLRALSESQHGLLIVGDVAAGKTTLLEAILPHVPDPESCWLVERTAEVRPPEDVQRLATVPVRDVRPGVDFSTQIESALAESPGILILDELRGDEAQAVWEALVMDDGPRCIFSFRSSPEPNRLRNAFSIMIRKGQPRVEQELINQALLERLPFVIATQIDADGMCVIAISEWMLDDESGDVTLMPLMVDGQRTGNIPRHAAGIDAEF